jgi:hypothetical protein
MPMHGEMKRSTRTKSLLDDAAPRFTTEAALVRAARRHLRTCEQTAVLTEFEYTGGRTDIVTCNLHSKSRRKVIAYEAKLVRWRDAVTQAYRASAFAHHSYVLLPAKTAEVASRHESVFLQLQVGLCTIRDGRVEVLIRAPRTRPLIPAITKRVFQGARIAARNNLRRYR